MKPLADRNPFRIGILAFVVAALVAVGMVVVSRVSLGSTTYTAVLAQSAGLKAGEDVQIAGVSVGEVTGVEIDGATVHATFTVKNSAHLGSRTTAAVEVATLLGSHLLSVKPGGSGDLADDTIPLARTTVPFNLQDVLDQGTRRIEQLDAPKLAKLLSVMSKTLSGSVGDFAPALAGVTRLSNVVASRSGQLNGLLKAAHRVTAELSASSPDLVALMKQTNLVVDEITARREAIHTLLTEASQLAGNVNALIGRTKADIHPALTALNGALAELKHQDGALRKVLDTMAPAVRYLANATGNAPYIDLTNHPPLLPANDGCQNAAIAKVLC